jgi:putative ABC transport system permease protein
MLSVYRTLSTRYLSKRWFRATLIVACIALGVATLVATQSLSETMNRAGLAASNPLAGTADLLVGGGGNEKLIDLSLADELRKIKGVRSAHPRMFAKIRLPDLDNQFALLIGIQLVAEFNNVDNKLWTVELDKQYQELNFGAILQDFFGGVNLLQKAFVVIGKDLEEQLPADAKTVKVLLVGNKKTHELVRVGTVDAQGPAEALGGNILIVEISAANEFLELKNKANRIDLTLEPNANRDQVKEAVRKVLNGRAEVHTPEESNQMLQSVFSGMQTGFSLCGIAALVVGLFLVYNALAVSVAERRHEIGVILSLGATRTQIQLLFAGEAALLGLVGSLLGIPLGIGLAYVGLQPVQQVLRDIFMELEARQVDVSTNVLILAVIAGTVTAVLAALIPAITASGENPAEAVRRVPPKPTWHYRMAQIVFSAACMGVGLLCMALRHLLPYQLGTFGGLVLVLLGALVATPLLAAVAALLLQPIARRIFGIEGRLAADNLVRSPARTGLVIAAMAAGVSLVLQIAGTIKSNREALRDWVHDTIHADLFVTSGSAVGAGSQNEPMAPELLEDIAKLPEVDRVLPLRGGKHTYAGKQILIVALAGAETYAVEKRRNEADPREHRPPNPLFAKLAEKPNSMIVSENFRALHGIKKGDRISLSTPNGPAEFTVIGEMVDYSWNHGSLFVNRADFVRHWGDDKVDMFDIYLKPGSDEHQVRQKVLRQFGAEYGLVIQTRTELQAHIDSMIERLYGIAYGQLVVVMLVAALGVVTALLISVLQRRREMGLLRAIGASQVQIVRSVLAEAALMGVIGTAIGLLVGIPMEWYVLQVVLLEESGYLFAMQIPWMEALVIAAAALVLATLAGLGPALYAVRERIPEAIAYE